MYILDHVSKSLRTERTFDVIHGSLKSSSSRLWRRRDGVKTVVKRAKASLSSWAGRARGNASINKHRTKALTQQSVMVHRRDESKHDDVTAVSRFRAFVRMTWPLRSYHSAISCVFLNLSFLITVSCYVLSCVVSRCKKCYRLAICTLLPFGRRSSTVPSVLIDVYGDAFSINSAGRRRRWRSGSVASLTATTHHSQRRFSETSVQHKGS